MFPDEVEIDGAVSRQGLLQGRASLNLDKISLEIITAGKCGDDLVALLRRVLIVSNTDDVHQDARVGEGNLGPHILGDAGRGMQRDGFPHQIRLWLGNAVAPEKRARCIGAVDFKPLFLGMICVNKAQIVKQRGDVEQFRIELQILADTFHRTEREDANRVVEQQLGFVLAHQFSRFARDLAIGNFNAGKSCGGPCI